MVCVANAVLPVVLISIGMHILVFLLCLAFCAVVVFALVKNGVLRVLLTFGLTFLLYYYIVKYII